MSSGINTSGEGTPLPRFPGESLPIATNQVLRGVDLAFERLAHYGALTAKAFDVMDNLRNEVTLAAYLPPPSEAARQHLSKWRSSGLRKAEASLRDEEYGNG